MGLCYRARRKVAGLPRRLLDASMATRQSDVRREMVVWSGWEEGNALQVWKQSWVSIDIVVFFLLRWIHEDNQVVLLGWIEVGVIQVTLPGVPGEEAKDLVAIYPRLLVYPFCLCMRFYLEEISLGHFDHFPFAIGIIFRFVFMGITLRS